MSRLNARLLVRRGFVATATAAVVLVGAIAVDAAAQTPQFQQRFNEARKVFDSDRQAESIPLFTELIDNLNEVRSRPEAATRILIESLLYRAQARLNFGQQAEAADDVRRIQTISPTYRPTDRNLSPVLLRIFETPAGSSGSLRIRVSPSGTRVTIDGADAGLIRVPIPVPAGRKSIVAAYECHESATQTVDVAEGQTVDLVFNLRRLTDARCNQTPRRLLVGFNRGYHYIRQTSESNFMFRLYNENGDTHTEYQVAQGFDEFNFGAAARAWGALAVGINYSVLDTTTLGLLDSRIPHPTIFNLRRTLIAQVPNLKREERAVHVEVRATRGGRRVEAAAFVGPSFFTVRQAIVSNVFFRDLTTSVAFTSAETREISEKQVIGFNVGGDVAVMVNPYVGFGGFVRYSQATVDFVNGRDTGRLLLGGLQTGGGLRVRY